MDVSQHTEPKQMVTVDGVEFEARRLSTAVSWLSSQSQWDGGSGMARPALDKLVELGYAEKYQAVSMTEDGDSGPRWSQVGRKCQELYGELNEPYSKWRVAVADTTAPAVVWDESEQEDAKLDAVHAKAVLERRNPDVEFRLAEEELNDLPY